jgi:hypothetical protein|nr:MAG TPA: hypothetical protein [Caudoviricetes sp.]
MSKKQLAQAGVLAAMITVLFEYLMFYHAWLLINGICTLGIFACIFFLVVLVGTKGAILPNPYPHCSVLCKEERRKDE